MKKTKFIIPIAIVFLLIVPLSAGAFMVKTTESLFVGEEEVIEGSLYAGSNIITIDGRVKGDLICAGQSININGTIEGDLICGAQTININGTVNGNARVAGNTININGSVKRNVNALGAVVYLNQEAEVGWEMFIAGQSAYIKGKVGGDLHGAASTLDISGEINGDVKFRLDQRELKDGPINISSEAKIGGNVYYTGGSLGQISPDAQIAGETGHSFPKIKEKNFYSLKIWSKLFSIFAGLVVGLVLISLWRKPIIDLTDNMLDKPSRTIGFGLALMFLTPIISVLLMVTLIGIPLSLIILAVWAISLYASKILVSILIGRLILEKLWEKKKDSLIWAMIGGILITFLACGLPVVGWVFCLAAIWWGLGGIWLYFKKS